MSEFFLSIAASVFQLLVVLPLAAIFYEDGWDEIGRTEFACWLAGYLFAWLVLVMLAMLLLNIGLLLWVFVWPGLVIAGICIYAMYHFFEAVTQRARDIGLGKGFACVAAVPPLNLALYAFLLIQPGTSPSQAPPGRRRGRSRRWRSRLSAWLRHWI